MSYGRTLNLDHFSPGCQEVNRDRQFLVSTGIATRNTCLVTFLNKRRIATMGHITLRYSM